MPAKDVVTSTAIVFLLVLLAGCSRKLPTAPGPANRDALTIEATCDTVGCRMPVGSEWTFSAVVVHSDGSRERSDAEWTSADATLATVDQTGRVKAIRSGTTLIHAKVGALTASRHIQVQPRPLASWQGRWATRDCSATGDFDETVWCRDFYAQGSNFELYISEDNGQLSGGVAIDFSGGGLDIDEGATLDAEGRLHLSARGELGLGPFVAIIDPLNAQFRGTLLKGTFNMKIVGPPGSHFSGGVLIAAELKDVTQR